MSSIHEVAMMAALACPMLAIAAINVSLYLAGERGTLLLPDRAACPAIELESLSIVQGFFAVEPQPVFVEQLRLAA